MIVLHSYICNDKNSLFAMVGGGALNLNTKTVSIMRVYARYDTDTWYSYTSSVMGKVLGSQWYQRKIISM